MAKKQNTSWGKVAGWYDSLLEEEGETYQAKVILPNLLRLLRPGPGQEILDVACGQGFFARAIAAAGAQVVGADLAGELIRLAKDRAGSRETYLNLPAENLKGLAAERFDAVICILALQNIKNLQAAVAEMARVTKAGARVILVLNHPAFRIPTASSWGFDQDARIQYRRVDRYLSELSQTVDMTQGVKEKRGKIFTYSFHRPLQVYFKAFAKSGLAVTRLEEWISHKSSDAGPRKAAEDLARREIPLFLCLELRKLPAS